MLKVLVWGTGGNAQSMMPQVFAQESYDILGFVDNDKSKAGQVFMGVNVFSPEVIKEIDFDKLVIMSDYYEEIYNEAIKLNPSCSEKIENKYYFAKESIIKRYENSSDKEIRNIINRIEQKGLDVFNYDFSKEYDDAQVIVQYDSKSKMHYVCHKGKRLFFPANYSVEYIEKYYKSICKEQDIKSPHRYQDDIVKVEKGDIVVDAGAAEGFFSLESIDLAEKIYIIEPDQNWNAALKKTFENYSDRITIINNFLDSYNEGKYVTLDSIIKEPVNFIKMDIEGSEYDALCGAKKLVTISDSIKMSICSYHRDYDQFLIESYMDDNSIHHYTSDGYMWFPYTVNQCAVSTKLVRGIIRGIKR